MHFPISDKDIIEFPCGKAYFRGKKTYEDLLELGEIIIHPFKSFDWYRVFTKALFG
jgi:hypothetical protein